MSLIEWTAIDGEGVGSKPHRYVLLCDSRGDYLEDIRGLTTQAILSWLLNRAGKLCGYYLSYDYTMWLKDLPNKTIYRLFRPHLRALPNGGFSWVRWRGYQLHYLQRSLSIKHGDRYVRIWDLGPYYQCPFVEALKKSLIDTTELTFIQSMKEKRGGIEWETVSLDLMRRYCLAECRLLAELARKLETSHHKVGIRPSSWYGPGSVASFVLRNQKIDIKRGDIPLAVQTAAEYAYFGGRFENSAIGRFDSVWGYDITSAYPAQTALLPCLEHGIWKKSRKPLDCIGLINVEVTDIGDRIWGPLPCRLGDGKVVFPRGGFSGWYWSHEYNLAVEYYHSIKFLEGWYLFSECECKPFSWVLDMFQARKTAENPLEKQAWKLALNSIYGKLAQRIGNPKYSSVVWSGLITSGTRAELLRLLLRHKNEINVIALATDGLYSTERIACPENPELGEWSAKYHGPMWFIRPGIYWTESDKTIRARGMGRAKLQESRIIIQDAIVQGLERVDLGSAIAFGALRETVYKTPEGNIKRSKSCAEWHPLPCTLSLSPRPKRDDKWRPILLSGIESKPYNSKRQGLLDIIDRLTEALRS